MMTDGTALRATLARIEAGPWDAAMAAELAAVVRELLARLEALEAPGKP